MGQCRWIPEPEGRHECREPAHQSSTSGRCIFHMPADEKRALRLEQVFVQKVVEKFETIERDANITSHDYRGFVFPDGFDSFNKKRFGKPADFSRAAFGDEFDLVQAEFLFPAKFHRARFGNREDFHASQFKQSANFDHATFGNKSDSTIHLRRICGFRWCAIRRRNIFRNRISRQRPFFRFDVREKRHLEPDICRGGHVCTRISGAEQYLVQLFKRGDSNGTTFWSVGGVTFNGIALSTPQYLAVRNFEFFKFFSGPCFAPPIQVGRQFRDTTFHTDAKFQGKDDSPKAFPRKLISEGAICGTRKIIFISGFIARVSHGDFQSDKVKFWDVRWANHGDRCAYTTNWPAIPTQG